MLKSEEQFEKDWNEMASLMFNEGNDNPEYRKKQQALWNSREYEGGMERRKQTADITKSGRRLRRKQRDLAKTETGRRHLRFMSACTRAILDDKPMPEDMSHDRYSDAANPGWEDKFPKGRIT